jgi:hypothetical protein
VKNNSINNTTKLKKTTRTGKLVLVRQHFLLGLTVEEYKIDTISINRGIVSTPNILYYSSNTKCLIDFTNLTNSSIDTNIKDYFSQIVAGMTMTVLNGEYYDPNLKVTADISGTYTFQSFSEGIVKANVSSVTGLSSKFNRYDKTKFTDIPYIIASSISTPTEKRSATILKNKLGKNSKNSFSFIGISVGDYIEIPSVVTPTQVLEIGVDADGNEYILIDLVVTPQDLTTKSTLMNCYIDVVDSYQTEPKLTDSLTGACISYQGGAIINCSDNNTFSQCRFRSSKTKGISTEFTANTFCRTPETDTAVETTVTENLVQITTALVNNMANITNPNIGSVNRSGTSSYNFYGRSF